MKVWMIIGLGLVLHSVFFFSIFEIYFTTPMVGGMTPHASPLPPPARRLVFIVADGLRADKIMELRPDGSSPAPFLRNIIKTQGSWGVSHAAVPTATRPGHVALTAGFYEDPTSVAKAPMMSLVAFAITFVLTRQLLTYLQNKAVMFDTVFNESRYTWSWDTPMFLATVTGGNPGRMFSKKYPGHMKWLAGINAEDMDSWVLKEAHDLFAETSRDEEVRAKMNEDRILFFLHLGGLDHSGYIVRPNSDAYLQHITFVDNGVKELVKEVEAFYNNDGKTAYVFTSDHGMTDWGAHGDGTPAETLTPLIVWGPGVKTPEPETVKFADGLSEAWGLSAYKRTDIRQASMAALLSALVGIPFPMNSILPVPDELFNISDHERAEMLFANLRQLLAQYEAVRDQRRHNSIMLTFRPFTALQRERVETIKSNIQQLIATEQYTKAIEDIRKNIDLTLKGLRYYKTYDRHNMWCSIVLSYIGWMVYLVTAIMEDSPGHEGGGKVAQLSGKYKAAVVGFFTLLSIIIFVILYIQSMVWTTYVYLILPCPIWMAVFLRLNLLRPILSMGSTVIRLLPYLALTFVGLEFIVLGFIHREMMSVVLFGLGAWPWVFKKDRVQKRVLFQWTASCLTVAFFPLLPVGQRELNFNLVVFGGILVIAVACFLVKTFAAKQLARRKFFLIFCFQILVIALSTFIVRHTAAMAESHQRTPFISQALSWVFLGLGVIEPFLVTTDLRCRLLTILLAWMSPFILFSISYECLFVLSMCWNLYVWMVMEANFLDDYSELPSNAIDSEKEPQDRSTRLLESSDFAVISNQIANGRSRQNLARADLRRAFYFIFLCVTSLFGTGNIASVNSFDPASVFCFVSIENPPFMGALIALKIAIPFILIACTIRAVNVVTHVPTRAFNFLVLLMFDIVAFHFFLLVNDDGTWLQVGESVSHYVIIQIINMVVTLILGFSYLITTGNICCFNGKL